MAARSANWRSWTDLRVGGRDVDLAAEQAGHVALGAHRVAHAVHVGADAGEALEVGLDVGPGLVLRDRELVGEAERRDAVDDAEVDRLGAPARLGRHALDRHAEHLRGGGGVDVEAVQEGALQLRDVADVGDEPQLDLAVVGADQHVAGLGDEGAGGSCGPPRCAPGCSAGWDRSTRAGRWWSRPAR